MKSPHLKIFVLLTFCSFTIFGLQAQEHRFNSELDKYCKTSIKDFRTIPSDRKAVLDDMAKQLSQKKYVVFACKTNSRRTLLLQVWAQTAFYYFGVQGKYAFSIGDTITSVYPGVAEELTESGFYCTNQKNVEPSRYVISISQEFPLNMLSSKNEVGTIDTAKGIIANICFDNEQSSIIGSKGHVNLPYQSPTIFEGTAQEKQKYRELNHQISVEMLYLADRTREIIYELTNPFGY